MALPEPKPGLVIRYAFLWGREAKQGQEEGKERPCAVVLTTKREGDQTRVLVAPITHTAPAKGTPSVEIPLLTKQRLGLDYERSWIITNELNQFTWPGQDIRPIPGRPASPELRFSYGMLGPKTLTGVVGSIQQQRLELSTVERDESPALAQREFRVWNPTSAALNTDRSSTQEPTGKKPRQRR